MGITWSRQMSDISRKEFIELNLEVSSIKKDVNSLQDWRKDEVDPMLKKAEAFENQFKGAKKLLWIMVICLMLLTGERFSEHIPIKALFDILGSQSFVDSSTVSASTAAHTK